jgi:CubicO group peptidase (beta-lactamase class C family)
MTTEGGPPVRRDTIFRLASMTKPITAAAAMMLIEEGKLRLDEPIERLAPELADRRVLRRIDGPLDDTVPAARAITLEDVLTFRLGWGVLFTDDHPIDKAVAGLPGFGMPDPRAPITPDQYMRRLGALPLMAQPGERWLYTVGSNVLGVLVARAAGKPLDVVLAERIFQPLGMKDTAFHIAPQKLDRFITGYTAQAGKLTLFDPPDGMYRAPPAFPAGDSGLVSTADDFDAFARFMLDGLAGDGRPLLSRASLAAMTTDRLTAAQREGGRDILGPGRGWGYGLGVAVEASPYGVPRGAYGWDGGFGTSWFNDPATGLRAILLTQRVFDSPDPPQAHKDFWRAAVQAVG